MIVPCRMKSLKYIKYGDFEMSKDAYADVSLHSEKGTNRYRMLRVTCGNSSTTFTEAALESAIERGDFSLA